MFDRCYGWKLLKNEDFLLWAQSLVSFGSGSVIQRKLHVVPIGPDILSYPYAVLEGVGACLLPAELWEVSSVKLRSQNLIYMN